MTHQPICTICTNLQTEHWKTLRRKHAEIVCVLKMKLDGGL